ncbi:transposase [Pseudonocardia bannensis]|uniref:Transposase n=1 Tax=Pseudonocardia bannensis TaxID=630973 RepID=A0A848DHD5_9PSEU|nr:transposase [Pseudonocardia bannensis]
MHGVLPGPRPRRGRGRGAVQTHPAGGADGLVGADRRADRDRTERCFNRLKQFRALATRYAKRAAYYRAEIIIVAIVLSRRTDLQDTT